MNSSLEIDTTMSAVDNAWLTGTGFSGALRALEQSYGRDPATMIPDVRFTAEPERRPGRTTCREGGPAMLTRFIKRQLVLFGILTRVALLVLGVYYLRIPSLVGIGQYQLKAELPASGGLYPTSNVDLSRYHDRQGDRRRAHRKGRRGDDEHRQPVQDPARRVGQRAFGVGGR